MLEAQQEAYDREENRLQEELSQYKADEMKIKESLAVTQELIKEREGHISELEQ